MRARALILVASGLLVGLVAAGCGKKAESVSDSDYLLSLLDEAWSNGVATLNEPEPNLNIFRALWQVLTQRAPRRVEKDYPGDNKDQLLADLKSLGEKFDAEVASKMDFTSASVRLKPGATIDQVREAFMALNPEYEQLKQMVAGD